MKYIAFDIGTKHTGVATSHDGLLARGIKTWEVSDPDQLAVKIKAEVRSLEPDELIIGLPQTGPNRVFIQKVLEVLQREIVIPIRTTNEDFTSREAVKALIQSGAGLKARQTREHEVAAAAILQQYLEDL